MKFNITVTETTTKSIEIELPYYYEHDLSGDNHDCIIYGKITEYGTYNIEKSHSYNNNDLHYNLEKTDNQGIESYFQPQYKGSKKVYDDIYAEVLEFLKQMK